MRSPSRSYIIACTPRSGSNLLADGLAQTGIAGNPAERFPRPSEFTRLSEGAGKGALILEPPPEISYDEALDAEYVSEILTLGTTENGVFGLKVHRFQIDDVVRRVKSYLGTENSDTHQVLSSAFPNLSYIWLRRRDKIAQAVSWHKAVQSNQYIKTRDTKPANSTKTSGLEFNYTAIRTYRSALECSDRGWEYYFSQLAGQPFTIWYEDIAEHYERSLRQVLAFLELDKQPFEFLPPKHQKAADAQSLEWIERFRRLG